MAEMGRRMGCNVTLVAQWETDIACPDADSMNQLRFLQDHVDTTADFIAQKPLVEKEMDSRGVAQLTHRDLLKDFQ
jgi:hypothetical protein